MMLPCLKKRLKSEKINVKTRLLINSSDLRGRKAGEKSGKAQGAGRPETTA